MVEKYKTIADKKVWETGVRHLGRVDKTLNRLIRKVGVTGAWEKAKWWWEPNHYESIVRSIIFQQISTRAGISILNKFKSLYGDKLPLPREFLRSKKRTVLAVGISSQKYSYLKDLCQRIEDGKLELKKFCQMSDEDIIKELDEVRGIGRWTAEMYLIGTLGRVDVFPVDDLGIRKTVRKLYGFRKLPDRQKLNALSQKWRPYRTIAAVYFWQSTELD